MADPFIENLSGIVGRKFVITNPRSMERYCTGFRSGSGTAIAVVRPGTLTEMWRVLQACVASDKIIIMQAANTGLTEGSTPNGTYDRDVVVLSTNRMDQIQVLQEGRQVISFPGSTLFSLVAAVHRVVALARTAAAAVTCLWACRHLERAASCWPSSDRVAHNWRLTWARWRQCHRRTA